MNTQYLSPEDKKAQVAAFLARIAPLDSLVLVASHNVEGGKVLSETLTFIHMQHVTAVRNTCLELTLNLDKMLKEDKAGEN